MSTDADVVAFMKERAASHPDFDTRFDDVEFWSSFERIENALAAEERFSVQFSTDELSNLNSPKSFVDLIRYKLNSK